ncbi:MAG TPA: thioredoxin domain-containing protein [Gaiellaceae bacterium]
MERNRLLLLAAAAAAAIVAVVVIVVVAGGGSSTTQPTTTQTTRGGGTEATRTFAGVAQHGATLGKASAPATMYVFEDPQCPYCRQWNIDTLPTVVDNYVRAGRVKLVYRGIQIIGANSIVGISAIYAAGLQGKAWQMAEALYERQGAENSGWITLGVVRQAAGEIHANVAKLVKDMKSDAVLTEMRASAGQAQSLGVQGTPTFGIQKPLGTIEQLQISSLDPSGFTPALDAALS